MWGNNFFSSTVYLSVLLGCGSIMDIFWDFRILPGSNLNQEKFTSADSECQGPVRILREGVGLKYGFHVSIDTFFLADKSLLNLIFFFFLFLGILHPLIPWPPSMNQVSGHHDISDGGGIQLWNTLHWRGTLPPQGGKHRLWYRPSILTVPLHSRGVNA